MEQAANSVRVMSPEAGGLSVEKMSATRQRQASAARRQALTMTLSADDADACDNPARFTFAVNWSDGSPVQKSIWKRRELTLAAFSISDYHYLRFIRGPRQRSDFFGVASIGEE
jgi:hypothetical protein